MAEKQYKGRKAYLNDFKKNEKGGYTYEGTVYEWKKEPEAYKRTLLTLWILGILLVLCAVGAGFFDAPGAVNRFYVILPYITSFVAAMSVLWGMIRLTEGKLPLRSYIYQASIEKLPVRTRITMIFSGISLAGELFYVIRYGTEEKLFSILCFLGLEAVTLLLALTILKIVQKMPWEKQEMR